MKSARARIIGRGVITMSLMIAGIFLVFLLVTQTTTRLSMVAPAHLRSDEESQIPATLAAYSAEAPYEELYRLPGEAIIKKDSLTIEWQTPNDFKGRDVYVELCVEGDDGNSSSSSWCKTEKEKSIPTCAYFVSSYSTGRIASLLGRNQLGESQKVGCAPSDTSDRTPYVSYIQAMQDVAKTVINPSLPTDTYATVDKKTVQEVVDDVLTAKNPSQQLVIREQNSVPGRDGANGKDGVDGAPGLKGEAGERGEKGEAGNPGRDGTDGRDGQDGTPGVNGRDGIDGQDGADGRDGRDGAPGRDGVDGQNGTNGRDGIDGTNGTNGVDGADGKSAYEIWLELGNMGDESEFLASLKGEPGDPADSVALNVIGSGLVFDGLNLSLTNCPEGQFLKITGGIYACSNDSDTTYTAGAGLMLSANNIFSLDITNCSAEQGNKLTYQTGAGFVCAPDIDTNTDAQALSWNNGTRTLSLTNGGNVSIGDNDTTYTADPTLGLTLNGTVFGLRTCADSEVLKFTAQPGNPGEWICATDNNTSVDLSGYLQVANLEAAITALSTPGYYNKSEVDSLIQAVANATPASGLKVPVAIANESDLPTDLSTYEEGYHWHVGNMDITAPDRTGRAWVYDDNGTKQIFKTIDQYLSPDTSSIVTDGGGRLTVSTAWLASQLSGYVAKSELPVCGVDQYLSYNGSAFVCSDDKDTAIVDTNTLYSAGNGLSLTGNTFAINATTCTGSANKLTYDAATGFICETDEVVANGALQTLTYVAGTGTLSISDGNSITLSTTQAGNGLRLDGDIMSADIPAACSSDQKLTWTGTGFRCAKDVTMEAPTCSATGTITYQSWDQLEVEESSELWLRLDGRDVNASDYPLIADQLTADANGKSIVTPTMTSGSTPTSFVPRHSTHWQTTPPSDSYASWRAFNRTTTNAQDGWASASGNNVNQWVSIEMPYGRTVNEYSISGRTGPVNYTQQYPRTWRLEGSNTGANGSWVELDRRTNITDWQSTPTADIKTFTVQTPGDYRFYRLFVDQNNSTNDITFVGELKLFNADTTYKNLPFRAPNVQGQYAYMKVNDDCPKVPGLLDDGTTTGHVLMWNGTAWAESGDISIDTLSANAITAEVITIDRIRDSTGATGAPGQRLTVGPDGKIIWQ